MARFVFAVILSVVSVTALGAETIELGPSDWRKWDPRTSHHSLEGLRTSYGQPVRMGPSGGSLSVTRNPVIPYGAIGNGLKGLARTTPQAVLTSAAISGIFAGMSWYFDQQSGQWVKDEPKEIFVDPLGGYWTSSEGGEYSSPVEACASTAGCQLHGACTPGAGVPPSGYCRRDSDNSPFGTYTPIGVSCPPNATLVPRGCVYVEQTPVPLTDADYSELTAKLPTLPADTVGSAAGDTMTRQGAPLPGFSDSPITGPSSVSGPSTSTTSTGPEGTITSTSTTTTNISYGPTTITTTNTTTTNTYTNGEPSGTTTTTETPSPDLVTEPPPSSGSTSLDIPTDCEFMPTVCAFLDWFKEPMPMPEPDLPVVVDHDFEREYEMNLTAECPPPYTVETQLFGTLSISWQPFCDLASLIKPLVVGSAFLLSAFITLGIGRGKA